MQLRDIIVACQNAVGAQPDGNPGTETWSKLYAKLLGGAPPYVDTATSTNPSYVLIADGNHNDPWPPPSNIPAFIHKATEGTWFRDPNAAVRRDQFKAGGGKWGWYHFSSGEGAVAQAQHFLDVMNLYSYRADDLVCLDFEDSSRQGDRNMTAAEAQQWIGIVEAALACRVCVYGSDLLTGALQDDPTAFAGRPLWPAWYYSTPPILPANRQWAIWQFTANGQPYSDMDRFPGTLADLQAAWPQGLRI